MTGLLFLVHRLPYPPNKGDKIRSFNILQYLSTRYHVYLGTFIDEPEDWQHVKTVKKMCVDACFAKLARPEARWRSLRGFISGEPLTVPYYRDRSLQRWVDAIIRCRKPERILVYSSAMAQYVIDHLECGARNIIDFVDVDSDKWCQYSKQKLWPISWIYKREYRQLLLYERALASRFDVSIFVSRAEVELFKELVPDVGSRITYVSNGVDADFFSPRSSYPNPYPCSEKVLVFTGAMDYWPNIDAVCWFVRDIFPRVRTRVPAARFYIVGANPARVVRRLVQEGDVVVTGRVADIRPYLAHAAVAVAPLRVARGVQNKVLEALAMGRPVVATNKALTGISPMREFADLVADNSVEFAERAIQCLNEVVSPDPKEREYVLKHFDWGKKLKKIEHLLEGTNATVLI